MGIADDSLQENRPYDWSRSVGVVETRRLFLDLPDGFRTESGDLLPSLEVAYETYGVLDSDGGNAILVATPLTADCHVAGFHGASSDPRTRGWWDDMVGPGKAIDTRRWFVVCSSILGGCGGTTGPTSLDPRTGRPWGGSFPNITIGDMVEVQRQLLDALGVGRLYAVVGGSMGGMQALEWSLRHPDRVERCAVVAAGHSLSAQALAFDIVGRGALLADPSWADGSYEVGLGPERGLSLARQIAHITYLSAEGMASKFGRQSRPDGVEESFHTAFEVEKYLEHQGRKFVERFDANAYVRITLAMDRFDLALQYGRTPLPGPVSREAPREARERYASELAEARRARLSEAFERSRCRYLLAALSTDWLFPARESWEIADVLLQQEKPVSFCQLQSPHGHDGFLLEAARLDAVLSAFLAEKPREPSPEESVRIQRDRLERGAPPERDDYMAIRGMVRPGSRVLDIGCGDGRLLHRLCEERGCRGEGLDLDLEAVLATMRRNLPALQTDADEGLSEFADGSWDYVILTQTLQAVVRPKQVLDEIVRVGREAIVSFPNFGNWRCRLAVLLTGRMPMTADLPHMWYETPNLHPFTLADFEDYCRRHGIEILEKREVCDSLTGKLLRLAGFGGAGADRVVARIARARGDRP